jgi:DNA replication protein DnaC
MPFLPPPGLRAGVERERHHAREHERDGTRHPQDAEAPRSIRRMELAQFCASSRVVIVAGKGGVGKTTVAATLATAAARTGASVLVVEVEGKSGLATCFGVPSLDLRGRRGAAGACGCGPSRPTTPCSSTSTTAACKRISRRMVASGTLDIVAHRRARDARHPPVGEGRSSSSKARAADLIILDAPAAGHAITFLFVATRAAGRGAHGPGARPGRRSGARCSPIASRCQVLLVTLPRGDAGERGGRDRVRARGPGRHRARPGRGEQLSFPSDGAATRARSSTQSLAGVAVAGRRRTRDATKPPASSVRRRAIQDEQIARLARRLPLPQIACRTSPRRSNRRRSAGSPTCLTAQIAGNARMSDASRARRPRRAPARRRLLRHGGVGKTTTAAALAVEGARRGRRTAVITIDPGVGDWPTRSGCSAADDHEVGARRCGTPTATRRPAVGSLRSCSTPDRRSTGSLLATRRTTSSATASSRTASTATSRARSRARRSTWRWNGCHELHETGDYDLIIVDTPPTRHALDFLDAPQRLIRTPRQPRVQVVMVPARRGFRVATAACTRFVRQVGRVIGTAVIDDIISFFRRSRAWKKGSGRAPTRARAAHRAHDELSCS